MLSRQGVVRALIAATITRPGQAQARPGLRFGLIDSALAPLDDTLGATDPAAWPSSSATWRSSSAPRRCSASPTCSGLNPEEAIASIVHTATTLTRAALRDRESGKLSGR